MRDLNGPLPPELIPYIDPQIARRLIVEALAARGFDPDMFVDDPVTFAAKVRELLGDMPEI